MNQASPRILSDNEGLPGESKHEDGSPELPTVESSVRPSGAPKIGSDGPTPQTFESLFSLANLRATCRNVKKEIRLLRARDSVDWLDWFLTLDTSLERLREQLLNGDYTPTPPSRYELGKSKGAYRIITSLNICDAVVYRHISDAALEAALPQKVGGSFFSRRHSMTWTGKTFTIEDDDAYLKFFDIWLRYNEYRSHTFLQKPYSCLVVTDISNYFDSIQHDLLIEYLAPLGLPREAVGLLGRLLETFKPPAGHSPNPRVGLPVDELDCSRQLAHVFLFEHDHRMVDQFGEDNYVRWMDDQNIGVSSESDARRVVNALTRSLSSQRLTVNSGKTLFLSTDKIINHFHLEANKMINNWKSIYEIVDQNNLNAARSDFECLWNNIIGSPHAEKGNWDKILKRMYGYAVKADSDLLEQRAFTDLVNHPDLDQRIFNYFAKRNKSELLHAIFSRYHDAGESLFEATEVAFFEASVLLDPDEGLAKLYLDHALKFARTSVRSYYARPLSISSAILSIYWFGGTSDLLVELFPSEMAFRLPKEVARAWMSCVAALSPDRLNKIQSALLGHPSDDVARLSRFLAELLSGGLRDLGNYTSKKSRWPLTGEYYDARSWLILDIASHSRNDGLRSRNSKLLESFMPLARTLPEKNIAARIAERLQSIGIG